MISKNRTKQIIALRNKKARSETRTYMIEGEKLVREHLKAGIGLTFLAALPDFIDSLKPSEKELIREIEACNADDLKKISSLTSPHAAVALVPFLQKEIDYARIFNTISVALDFVQDPGNLGTILRSAAWFGIRDIVCSTDCVDHYNPKVIQASMGAIINVNVIYTPLEKFLKSATDSGIPVYGAMLVGRSVYEQAMSKKGVILLGNESKGISPGLLPFITHSIMIPGFSTDRHGPESLNVAMAASVIFSEYARMNLVYNKA